MGKFLFRTSILTLILVLGGCNSNSITNKTTGEESTTVANTIEKVEDPSDSSTLTETPSEIGYTLKLLDEFNGATVNFLTDNRLLVNFDGDIVNLSTIDRSSFKFDGNTAIYNENFEFITTLENQGQVTVLSENHFFVRTDTGSTIYNEDFNIVKELGDIILDRGALYTAIYDGIFVYGEPYYHDSKMDYKNGLMDFDGNILYEAVFINPDDSNDEKIVAEMKDIIDKFGANDVYTYDNREILAYVKTDSGRYRVVFVQTYPNDCKIINDLGEYDELVDSAGICLTEDCKIVTLDYVEDATDRVSIKFKIDGKWGIVSLEGNYILEAEYEDVDYIGHDYTQNVDYYKVINGSGRVGIFSTENGLIVEPSLNLDDRMSVLNSNIIVYKPTFDSTIIYNDSGEEIKEFDYQAKISSVYDCLARNFSEKFYNIKRVDSGVEMDLGLLDNNFEFSPLLYEIYGNADYTEYATIGNDVIIGCEYLNDQNTYSLLTVSGELIDNLSGDSYSSLLVINGKYLHIDGKSYELLELK